MQREKLTPSSVAFVDDNSDNAFSMFLFCNGRRFPAHAPRAAARRLRPILSRPIDPPTRGTVARL